jgi:hypothetical protein
MLAWAAREASLSRVRCLPSSIAGSRRFLSPRHLHTYFLLVSVLDRFFSFLPQLLGINDANTRVSLAPVSPPLPPTALLHGHHSAALLWQSHEYRP